MERVYIGLGSNLAEPLQQLRAALDTIAPVSYTHLDVYKRQARLRAL